MNELALLTHRQFQNAMLSVQDTMGIVNLTTLCENF